MYVRGHASLLFVFNISGFLIFILYTRDFNKNGFSNTVPHNEFPADFRRSFLHGTDLEKKCIRRICNSFDEMRPYEIQAQIFFGYVELVPLQIKYCSVCLFVFICWLLIEKYAIHEHVEA